MITVEEAIKIIEANIVNLGTESIALDQGIGRVLQEDWYADRDFPPYNRVTMDGIALDCEAFQEGQRQFKIEGVAAAGSPLMNLENPTNCLEVMTGSILPNNTNAVVRYEDLNIENGQATVVLDELKHRQNIHEQGSDRAQGSLIVEKGTKLSPSEIGVGATIGKNEILVSRLPKTMILSTGDELVKIDEQPLPHQIRRSNVYRLKTTLASYQIQVDTDHLNDDYNEIVNTLGTYLSEYDVLMLSGGVSKGKFDFLPKALEELEVEKLFHKIKQRPGKPFWFGKYSAKQHPTKQCTVFALPGNPVSSFMCTQRYFTHWLQLSLGLKESTNAKAVLNADVHFKPDLTYFLEVKLSYNNEGKLLAEPIKGNGSGDLANLVKADAFIELPRGRNDFEKGEVFPIYFYR